MITDCELEEFSNNTKGLKAFYETLERENPGIDVVDMLVLGFQAYPNWCDDER